KTAWLDTLCDNKGPLLTLPIDFTTESGTLGIRTITGETITVPVRAWATSSEVPPRAKSAEARLWFARPTAAPASRPAYVITPSAKELGWTELERTIANAKLGAAEKLASAIRLDEKGLDYE